MADAAIAWGDCETTGLDARVQFNNKLLEIAFVLTDGDFNELAEIQTKFYFTKDEVAKMRDEVVPFVREMHDKTGLWEELSNPMNPTYEQFDQRLLHFFKTFQPEPGVMWLGGNSVVLDREFMREFLPESFNYLHYRNLDMTAVEGFFSFTEDRPRYEKKLVHSAMSDIRESIAQAHYHKNLNKPF